jgi:hypothetical protein
MNDLNSQARAVLEAARDADDPSPADRDRIKRAILVQVAVGAVASTATAGTMTLAMKVGLAVLAASLVGGGSVGYVHWQGKHRTSSLARHMSKARIVAPEVTAPPVASPAVAALPAAEPAPPESKAHLPERPRKLVVQGSDERMHQEARQEDPLNAEVAVLGRAREELRMGRPAQALEALLEYDRRFGKGALGEERQAIAAIAACQAHPGPSARAQAQAFMRSSPKSPLLDRVRATCLTPARPVSP